MAVLRPREGGLWRGKQFWLHLTTASVQCLHLSKCFFFIVDAAAAATITTYSFCLAGLFFQILLQAMPSLAKVFKGKTLSK